MYVFVVYGIVSIDFCSTPPLARLQPKTVPDSKTLHALVGITHEDSDVGILLLNATSPVEVKMFCYCHFTAGAVKIAFSNVPFMPLCF